MSARKHPKDDNPDKAEPKNTWRNVEPKPMRMPNSDRTGEAQANDNPNSAPESGDKEP